MARRSARRKGRPRRLVAIDLFAGAGGLTLGLRHGGFSVVGAIESDPLAVESYRRNHRKTHVWARPIEKVPAIHVLRHLGLESGELDLLAGCPPCQGFSAIRTKNGKRRPRDAHKNLLFQFLKFARALKPKVIMMENVPRLSKDRRMRIFRRQLRALGYRCRTAILNAVDYGVPQRRRRMIFLAARFDGLPAAQKETRRRTVQDVIKGLPRPGQSGDYLHDVSEHRSKHVRKLISRIPKDGGSRNDLGKGSQLRCHHEFDGFNDVYGRLAWKKPAPTITCGFVNPSKGRFLHPTQNRTITLREAALLQSFPSKYYFSLRRGKYPAAALIGNALPPALIKRITSPIATRLRVLEAEAAAR